MPIVLLIKANAHEEWFLSLTEIFVCYRINVKMKTAVVFLESFFFELKSRLSLIEIEGSM